MCGIPLSQSAIVARARSRSIISDVKSLRPAWLRNWLSRHQDPLSRGLHYVGIPLTVAALVLAGVQLGQGRWDLWWRPVVLLGAGYVLQYVGHRVEGNDMGEVILVKKLLGRPYCAVAPRYADGRAPSRPETRGE
jgi:hypothetical protein